MSQNMPEWSVMAMKFNSRFLRVSWKQSPNDGYMYGKKIVHNVDLHNIFQGHGNRRDVPFPVKLSTK